MTNQDGVEMPTHCPQCEATTEPIDFHVVPDKLKGMLWTYECRVCKEEKPTEEWVRLHRVRKPPS